MMLETTLRRRAFALLRRCFLPILIATLLAAAVDLASTWVGYIGEQKAAESVAHLHPGPEPTSTREDDPSAWVDYRIASGYEHKALESDQRKWSLIANGVGLLNLFLAPVVLLGLNRALLAAQRAEECRVSHLFAMMRPDAIRAILLELQSLLRGLGYMLIWLVVQFFLTASMQAVGSIISTIVLIPLAIWLEYRYRLAPLHLAEDASQPIKACIQRSIADVQVFSVMGMLFTIWPALLMLLAGGVLSTLVHTWWAVAIDMALTLLAALLTNTAMPVIYQHLRTVPRPVPVDDDVE